MTHGRVIAEAAVPEEDENILGSRQRLLAGRKICCQTSPSEIFSVVYEAFQVHIFSEVSKFNDNL